MKNIQINLQKYLKTKVHCIEIGNGSKDSILMNLEKQSKEACNKIKSHPDFQNKFNIFGVSQGTLIGRYIIEKCNDMKGKVQNYVSFMGPQMGIGYIPKLTCGKFCDYLNKFVSEFENADPKFLMDHIGPASYWKYRYQYDRYLKNNVYLKDLNNEGDVKNEEYKKRILNLNKILLIKGKSDTVITPRESSWFEFYDKKGQKIVPLKNSEFYIKDFIGIRKLNEEGRLKFALFYAEHCAYTLKEFIKYIVSFLKDDGSNKKK
jgi:palmitoyl-protein thioesterase